MHQNRMKMWFDLRVEELKPELAPKWVGKPGFVPVVVANAICQESPVLDAWWNKRESVTMEIEPQAYSPAEIRRMEEMFEKPKSWNWLTGPSRPPST